MATSPGVPRAPTAARPSWVSRNWKWVVPVAIVSLVLVFAAFIGSIFLVVETSFQHSDCYVQALQRTLANPEVLQKIGQPLSPGWLASGNINISGSSGSAYISIPISGPKGKGTVYVVAKKSAGTWTFQTLQVAVDGESQRIDLLKPEDSVPHEDE